MGETFAFEQLDAPAHVPPAPASLRDVASVVAAAHEEADIIRGQARQEAYAAGLAEGRAAALEELRPAVTAIVAAAEQARTLQDDAAVRLERDAVELALAIAEKALVAAVEVQPERVVDVVRGALRLLVERERVHVFVNPEDLEIVREAVGELTASLGGIEHLEVQAERRVARGGARLRTAEGEIDATLPTKLERAREALELELRGGGE
jgi:flagellar assembly protein FliH